MNINDKYIVALAKAAIFELEPEAPPEGLDWDYIFRKVNEQSISGLLYPAVSRLDVERRPEADLMDRWHKLALTTMDTMARRYNEFLRMSKLIAEAGITAIGLKGCIVRNLYPIPELRTMGDFDVLVHKKDLERIIELFQHEGYQIENDAFGVVCGKQDALWEIFTTTEEEFQISYEKMDEIYLNRCISNETMRCPEPTYFLAYLMVHTGKHYVGNGAGIRNLCDIALFIHKNKFEINFTEVERICQQENFGKIFNYLINSAGDWFGVDLSGISAEKCDTEQFLEYSLDRGIFGKHDNELAGQVSKRADDNIGAIRKIFFPSAKILRHRYPYLKKYPFFLPAAWVHRAFKAVFVKKRSVNRMAGELKDAMDFSDERNKRLKKLGLLE